MAGNYCVRREGRKGEGARQRTEERQQEKGGRRGRRTDGMIPRQKLEGEENEVTGKGKTINLRMKRKENRKMTRK